MLPVHFVTAVEKVSNRSLSDACVRLAMRRIISVDDRPRVGVAACLLGDAVRYDGGDKRHGWLVDVLGPQVEWVGVCPEVEAGFGTPREPMAVVRTADGAAVLMTSVLRPDLTARLLAFARERVAALAAERLDGYVFKAGSPSCGVELANGAGRGLFAAEMLRAFPDLPIVEERQLADSAIRDEFVRQVFARFRTRQS